MERKPQLRMRHTKAEFAQCNSCLAAKQESLAMYDIQIGDTVVVLCDKCNALLLDKSLSAHVQLNGRTKDTRDMAIIRKRQNGTYVKGGPDEDGTYRHPPTGYSVRYDAE